MNGWTKQRLWHQVPFAGQANTTSFPNDSYEKEQ
jgi:hypothetical protein